MPQDDKWYVEFAKLFRETLIQDECATWHWLAFDNLKELRHFLDTVENFIEREETRAVSELEKHDTYPDFWADNYPTHWQEIIGSQLRQSFVVSLMAATEFYLSMLCRDVEAIVVAPIALNDLRGSTLERARKYLSTFGKFALPTDASWEELGDLYALRNVIVHNGAMIEGSSKSKRIDAMIRRSPGISNRSAGFLEIKREFCTFAHEAVVKFFEEASEALKGLCRNASRFAV
ncbi:MAG: hypothetical protein L0Y38_01170 [Methylococcaceae bacterium]|nr:hypothetical protein [Methylococcaceae bacterium]